MTVVADDSTVATGSEDRANKKTPPESADDEHHVTLLKQTIRYLNNNDLKNWRECFDVDECRCEFHDCEGNLVQEMRWNEFEEQMRRLLSSFPDFKLNYHNSMQRLLVEKDDKKDYSAANSDDEEVTIFIPYLVATGTHTGEPFVFGPCEPIAATGKFIQMDPESDYVTFRNGKIIKYKVKAHGDKAGPAGVYTLLGGFPVLGKLPPGLPPPPP